MAPAQTRAQSQPTAKSDAAASAAQTQEALAPRNATEDTILEAARALLMDGSHEQVSIDSIARRAFVGRTTVYLYFDDKRAVMDRLVQQAFADVDDAAATSTSRSAS